MRGLELLGAGVIGLLASTALAESVSAHSTSGPSARSVSRASVDWSRIMADMAGPSNRSNASPALFASFQRPGPMLDFASVGPSNVANTGRLPADLVKQLVPVGPVPVRDATPKGVQSGTVVEGLTEHPVNLPPQSSPPGEVNDPTGGSGPSVVVPLPGAGAMALLGLGMIAGRRRR